VPRQAEIHQHRLAGCPAENIAGLDIEMDHMVAMNNAVQQGAGMRQLVAMSGNVNAQAPATQVAMNQQPTSVGLGEMNLATLPAEKPARLPFAVASQAQQANYAQDAQAPQSYVVRVGVFHDLSNAQTAYQSVASFGPAKIVRAVGANGPLYRVEMGPLDNKSDAESALTTAQGAGFEDAKMVVAEPQQISMR